MRIRGENKYFPLLIIFLNFLIWLMPLYFLFKLQVTSANAQFFKKEYRNEKVILPKRGNIYVKDKYGHLYLVATDLKVYDVYFNPLKAKNLRSELETLGKILNKEIILNNSQKAVKIADSIEKPLFEQLKKLNFDSVFFEPKYKRIYPLGDFLSSILGFASYDENNILVGRYGIEKFYDGWLRGETGIFIGVKKLTSEILGSDLILNIDYFVQKYAEKILKEGIEKYQAKGGLIVIITNDGKILAVAEEPRFNPNEYNKIKNYQLFLSKLTQNYEPGSVFKTIIFFIGLNENVYKPNDNYFDAGTLFIDGWPISNFDKKGRGLITLKEAFEQSLNTGAIYLEKLVGHSKFLSYLKKFKLDQPPNIDFYPLTEGNLKNLTKPSRDLKDVNFSTASFGQGIAVSPAHIISLFTTFANQGKMYNLLLVDKIVSVENRIISQNTEIIEEFNNPEALKEINNLLEGVTLNGSGKYAKTLGYKIGGKTGSAFIPYEDKPGYSDNVINTYVALFPLTQPKFIIFVRIDKPNQGLAMVTTVPLAKKMIDFLINYYNIPPDEKELIKENNSNYQTNRF